MRKSSHCDALYINKSFLANRRRLIIFPLLIHLTMSSIINSTLDPGGTLAKDERRSASSTLPRIDEDVKCPFICHFTSATGDEIECLNTASRMAADVSKAIQCKIVRETMRYVIGNRTSVRRIVPAGLSVLASSQHLESLARGSLLDVYLHMNILELESDALIGIENLLQKIQIFNVHRLHPDTFLKAKRLSTIIIDSQAVPAITPDLFSDDDLSTKKEKPRTFIRLLPEDTSSPLATNIDLRCHKCAHTENESDYSIITFPAENKFHVEKSVIDSIALTYLDSCRRLTNGLGCREIYFDRNNESRLVNNSTEKYILKSSASDGWDDEYFPAVPSAYNKQSELRIKYLVTSLIVWCSIISFVLFFLFLWIIIRRIRINTKKWTNPTSVESDITNVLLKRIVQQSDSCGDLTNSRQGAGCNGSLAFGTPSMTSNILPCNGKLKQWDSFSRDYDNILCSSECKKNLFHSAPVSQHSDQWRLSNDYSSVPTPNRSELVVNGDIKNLLMNGDPNLPFPIKETENGSVYKSNVEYLTKITPFYKRSKDGIFQLSR